MHLLNKHRYLLMAALSGLLLTGSFPKFGAPWVAWVALIPFFGAICTIPAGRRFRLGFMAGLVHYLTLVYWLVTTMQTYGGLPWYTSVGVLLLLCGYLALYYGVFASLLGFLAPTPLRCLGTAPFLWVCLELVRTEFLTGFPWELLGYTQYRALRIIQISDIFGVYGVSFLVVAVNTGLFLAWLALRKGSWQGVAATRNAGKTAGITVVVLLTATVGYGVLRMGEISRDAAAAPRATVSVLQGNIAQDVKWDPAFKIATTDTYLRLTREVASDNPDLIVWPETATPFYFQLSTQLTQRINTAIRETGAYFIIGSPATEELEEGRQYYNSAYLVTPEGTAADRYDKQHLVPFGEYVPWQKLLFFVKKMVPGLIDFTAGTSGKIVPWEKGHIGIQICYEMIFPAYSRKAVNNGAGLLVHLTNDAWFGGSSAPYQHLSMIAVRAAENKRAIVRSANTGISGFVGPTGKIVAKTPLFKEAALTRDVPLLEEKTIYTRWGDWFPAGCSIVVAVLICCQMIINRRKRAG